MREVPNVFADNWQVRTCGAFNVERQEWVGDGDMACLVAFTIVKPGLWIDCKGQQMGLLITQCTKGLYITQCGRNFFACYFAGMERGVRRRPVHLWYQA